MGIVDYIAIAVILLTVGSAVFYIVRAKRRGEKCIGCPYARQCASGGKAESRCGGGCSRSEGVGKESDKEESSHYFC